MASSGTTAAPTVFTRFKPHEGREGVVLMGKMRVKSTAVLEAGDLELRTIKSFNMQQYAHKDAVGGLSGMMGSVNTPGSLMNAVTLKSYKGSQNPVTGTTHVGTIGGGTQQVSFICLGA